MKKVGELCSARADAAAVRAAVGRDDEDGGRLSRTVHGAHRGQRKGRHRPATVKGDVHDIGKNLVDIILSNNGYRVLNLGIKAAGRHHPRHRRARKSRCHRHVGPAGQIDGGDEGKPRADGQPRPVDPRAVRWRGADRGYVEGALSTAYRTGEVYYGADAFTGLRLMDELCGHVAPDARTLTGPGRKSCKRERPRRRSCAPSAKKPRWPSPREYARRTSRRRSTSPSRRFSVRASYPVAISI